MNKRNIPIIVLILSLIILLTGCFSPKPWFLDFKKDYSVEEEENIDVSNDIEKIELKLLSENIRIIKSTKSKISITITGSIKSNFKPDIYVKNYSNTIEIRDSDKIFNSSEYKNNNLNFTVYIPEELHKDVSIDTITGNISIDGVKLKKLTTNNVSGSTKINSVESSNLNVDSVSGNIEIHNSKVFSIELDTVSGKNTLSNVEAKDLNFNSVSGSLKSNAKIESLRSDSVSGDISINTESIQNDYLITTVSGDISIDISNTDGFNFRFNSMSGEIETDRDLNYDRIHNDTVEGSFGSGGSLINVKTTSGDLIIN